MLGAEDSVDLVKEGSGVKARMDVLPHDLALRRNLEHPPGDALGYERIAVGQAARAGYDVAVES